MSLTRLSKGYEQSGLRLIDIKKKDRSIKFSNFVRYTTTPDANYVLQGELIKLLKIPRERIRMANISQEDVKKLSRNKTTCVLFFDIADAWASIYFKNPNGKIETLTQPIWYNSSIKVDSNFCTPNKEIYENINMISDIYSEQHKRWKTYKEISEQYQSVPNFLEYFLEYLSHSKSMEKVVSTE